MTFIQCSDKARARHTLAQQLAAEGFHPGPTKAYPAYRVPAQRALHALVQTLPGPSGWLLLRTSPSTLLAEAPGASSRPRLSQLCQALDAPAFMLIDTVFENDSGQVLLEVTRQGETFASGFWRVSGSEHTDLFCGLPLHSSEITPQTAFMQDLIRQIQSPVIENAFHSAYSPDEPSRFEALADELPPALVQQQAYELGRCFERPEGQSLFLTRELAPP